MLNKQLAQLKGVSLLELLLVLVVMGAMLFIGINRYQLYRQNKDITAVKQNVQLLQQALTIYYQLNCHASQEQNFTATMADLKQAGLLPNLINTGIASDYNVATKYLGLTQTTEKPIYQLSVMATLTTPTNTMKWYQNQLNATSTHGKQLTWIQLPSYSIPTTASELGILDVGLREFKKITSNPNDQSCAY